MSVNLQEFSFGIASDIVTPESPNYRPPSWPPPRSWPVVIDKNGEVVSRWGDGVWTLTPWHSKSIILNFGDDQSGKFSRSERIDSANADLLRIIVTWWIWGPKTANSVNSVLVDFSPLRQIFALCSREGIRVDQLMRFPKILEAVPGVLMPSKYDRTIAVLHRLYDAREALGFVLVDRGGLRRLVEVAPDHEVVQTPYIPPRIWGYQLERLKECLTDFLAHRQQLEACFQLCLDAYLENYGSYEAALLDKVNGKTPFTVSAANYRGCKYHGRFADTAARFGIANLLSKWTIWEADDLSVTALSSYMSIVVYAGLAYIANFTLQRKEEVATLRVSSLTWEDDEKLGRVPIISGETSKTDPDSDARWVASPSVAIAFEAASAIARLRLTCSRLLPAAIDALGDDPYLFSPATEPWSGAAAIGQRGRTHRQPLKSIEQVTTLFDPEKMRITPEDLELAKRFTPNLPEDEFAVGKVWPLAWHQYRRTGAVNMFASGVVSDSTMQQLMKHSSRLMPLYYGRNHTRLKLNEEVQGAVIRAMYEMQAQRVKLVVASSRFVSPHSQERKDKLVVNILSVKDVKKLASMARMGTISFREHRLGGCMKGGVCEYGGIESIARCGGGDGDKPCPDVLYDRAKEPQVRADLRRITTEIEVIPEGQPRHAALLEERLAMENFLNVVAVC